MSGAAVTGATAVKITDGDDTGGVPELCEAGDRVIPGATTGVVSSKGAGYIEGRCMCIQHA